MYNIDVQELMALLGEKDVEIHLLRKQLFEANKKLADLLPKEETKLENLPPVGGSAESKPHAKKE